MNKNFPSQRKYQKNIVHLKMEKITIMNGKLFQVSANI